MSDNGGAQLDGQRYSIHDIVVDDLDAKNRRWVYCTGFCGSRRPSPQNVTINHVTAFPSSTMLNIGNMVATNGPMKNFVFTNNI